MNDPIGTAIVLSWTEVRSVCQGIVKHPDNEGEYDLAKHLLDIMDRHIAEARAVAATVERHIAEAAAADEP